MIEVRDVKNVDKVISSVKKESGKKSFVSFLGGFSLAALLVIGIVSYIGVSLGSINAIIQILICGFAGSSLIASSAFIKNLFDKKRLKTIFKQVREQTGVELEVEDAIVALEKTDLNNRTSYDEEITHNIIETEVVKRFYMLDKNEQMQVLEFVRKTVKDHMGKTKSQSLSIFEEEEKKAIDYVGVKKELKFIPKPLNIDED